MTHGLNINELTTGPRPVLDPSLAVIGMVATATEASAIAAFPVNTPVLVSNINSAISDAGDGGTLKPALEAIADQTTPIIIVVRVDEDADQALQDANVIGTIANNNFTGLQALMNAEAVVGVRPRILGTPGLDSPAVVAQLVVAAQQMRSFAYAAAEGADIAAAIVNRDTYGARELMLFWPQTSSAENADTIARALGMRAKIDEQQGWHKTISNVAINGVSGISKDVYFDLLDPSTDAGVLNDNEITTIVRNNGFRFWGNRTCSDVPEFAFESAVRTSHALQDIIAEAVQPFMDNPMTISLIRDMLETFNAKFRQLVADGKIVGAQAFFDAEDNEATALASGKPKFRIEFTPAAPLDNPNIDLVITDYYYTGFADQLN